MDITQNWDAGTTAPSGWTLGSGYSIAPYTAATGGSGPNALRRDHATGGFDQTYFGTADSFGGNLLLSASFAWDADPSSVLTCALMFRNQGAPGAINTSTEYIVALAPNGTAGGIGSSKWLAGNGSNIGGSPTFASGTFAANTYYRLTASISGNTCYLRVIRVSDRRYLTPGGAWSVEPQAVTAFVDADISGAGMVGAYMAGGTNANVYLDDFAATAIPAAPTLANNAVFVGNSLMAGAHASGGNDAASVTLRILGSAYANVPASGAETSANLAIGGQSITLIASPNPNGYTRLIDTAAACDARLSGSLQNVLVVWEITNELSTPPQTITGTQAAQNLETYCLARRAAGWAKIVVGTCLPRAGQPGVRADFEAARQEANTWLRAHWAEFADALFDVGNDPTIGAVGANLSNTYYWQDGPDSDVAVHMRDPGYAITARSMADAMLASAASVPPRSSPAPLRPATCGQAKHFTTERALRVLARLSFAPAMASTAVPTPCPANAPAGRIHPDPDG